MSLSGVGQGAVYSIDPAESTAGKSLRPHPQLVSTSRRQTWLSFLGAPSSPPRNALNGYSWGVRLSALSPSCQPVLPEGLGCLLIVAQCHMQTARSPGLAYGLSHALCSEGRGLSGALMLHFPLVPVICCPSRMGAVPSCCGGRGEMPTKGAGAKLRAFLGRGRIMETLRASPLIWREHAIVNQPPDSQAQLPLLLK